MPLLISENDVNNLITMSAALTLIEEVFGYTASETASNQPRRRVASGTGTLNVMSAALPARDVMGLKAYPTGPGGVRFVILLFRASTSELLAIIEAGRLGELRTGAASGVATKHLAPAEASTLGLYGAGTQAATQLEAVAGVRKLDRVLVYARRPENVATFCTRMTDRLSVSVVPASSPDEPLECEIVTTATSSTVPLFPGDRVRPGTHLNVVGSNFASKAEIDIATVHRASLVVVDSLASARLEGGDLLPLIDRGLLSWEWLIELGDIVSGRQEGRRAPDDVTLFNSHGVASEDIVLAHDVWLRATRNGVGRPVSMFGDGA
ncbi:MAG: ornithine cyclodeaminase family protein [Chloroflexia bacterium]|nr:ornithine cyclodeaminase family protein [Chloroflexia bacterium]